MRKFENGDVVSFDIENASGTGWVVNAGSDKCDISINTLMWKDGFEEDEWELNMEGVTPCSIPEVSFTDIELIAEDDWDDAFRLEYVEDILHDELGMGNLSEITKTRVRKHLEVLCNHDNITALKRKGYLCYGGSPLYECDWDETVRCFEKVLKRHLDTSVANSLGYIFYYGRTNGGVPDYEKAYRYFSMAALDGNHESIYKLGDMFLKGRGVPVSFELSDSLYYRVYTETKDLVLTRHCACNFADAALRMASMYERKEYSWSMIYGKYLEADLGLRIRAWTEYYGDTVVRKNVDEGLEKYRNLNHDSEEMIPEVFSDIALYSLVGDSILHVKLVRKGTKVKGRVDIVSNKPSHRRGESYLMLTIPELSYCGFVRSFSFKCTLMKCIPEIKDGESISFYCKDITDDGFSEITFMTENGPVSLEGSSYRIMKPGKRDKFQPHWEDRRNCE